MALTKVPSNLDATIATTQSASDNSTNVATTAYVTTAISNLSDSAPAALNTLNEIAAALGDDANYASTTTAAIAAKLPLAGGTLTGNLTGKAVTLAPDTAGKLTIRLTTNAANDGRIVIRSDTTDKVDIQANGASYFNGGNVGIGDTSPIAKLTVKAASDTIRAESLATDAKNITMSYHDGNDQGQILCGQDGVVDKNFVLRGHTLIFQRNGGTEAMRISSNGSIGVGTTDSTYSMSLQNIVSNDVLLQIKNTTANEDTGIFIDAVQGGAATNSRIGHSVIAGNNLLQITNPNGHAFYTGTSSIAERMRIDSSGNVQIADSGKLITKTTSGEVIRFERASDSLRYSSIHANSTDAGGAFIQFKVHTGATATSLVDVMTLKGSGNVGIGTSSPSYKLQVSGTGGTRMMVENTDTNWAAVDIRAGGNQANYIFFKDDSAERARITVYDSDAIAFSTGNSPTIRMTLDSTGRLAVGGTATSGSSGGVTVSSASSGYRHMYIWNSGMYFWNGANEANLSSGGAWNNASDERLKENITDIPYGLAEVKQLQPKKYSMITGGEEQVGLIAQEVETIIPELVTTSGEANMKSLSYGNLNAVLIKAIQEQQTIIESLTARITTLEG